MIFWIITAIITFLFLRWLIVVPCLVPKRTLVGEKHPDYSSYRDNYTCTYSPIGMKVWIFALLILVSITPVLNIIGIIVGIVWPLIWRDMECISWDEVFPKGPGKIASFLNKPL